MSVNRTITHPFLSFPSLYPILFPPSFSFLSFSLCLSFPLLLLLRLFLLCLHAKFPLTSGTIRRVCWRMRRVGVGKYFGNCWIAVCDRGRRYYSGQGGRGSEAWLVCKMFPWFDVACDVSLTSSCCRLTKRMTCIFMRYMRNELFVVVADAAADAAAGGNAVRDSNSSSSSK